MIDYKKINNISNWTRCDMTLRDVRGVYDQTWHEIAYTFRCSLVIINLKQLSKDFRATMGFLQIFISHNNMNRATVERFYSNQARLPWKKLPLEDVSNYVTLRHVSSRHVTLRYVTLRYVALRYVTLRCVTLRYVTLRCIMLRLVTLRYVKCNWYYLMARP